MGATNERTVVVGFDGSPPSRHAVMWAADAASVGDARLRIVGCYETPVEAALLPIATVPTADLAEGVAAGLEEAAALALRRHPGLHVDAEVAAGTPAGVLTRAAESASMLVVGASSHHGAAAFWLGSTARAVARRSPVPVVVIRERPASGGVRRVIVGYDDTPASDAALRWAADAADRVGATLLVVHCWTTVYPPADSHTASIDEIEAALLLDRAVETARERCGVTVESELRLAEPGRELASMATDRDLLVLGRPRHGAILSGLLGSALNGVLERATVPVVVVPEPSATAEAGSAAGAARAR